MTMKYPIKTDLDLTNCKIAGVPSEKEFKKLQKDNAKLAKRVKELEESSWKIEEDEDGALVFMHKGAIKARMTTDGALMVRDAFITYK